MYDRIMITDDTTIQVFNDTKKSIEPEISWHGKEKDGCLYADLMIIRVLQPPGEYALIKSGVIDYWREQYGMSFM